MNIIDLSKNKLITLYNNNFLVVEFDINQMYESVVLSNQKVALHITNDLREGGVDIRLMRIVDEKIPTILEDSKIVNIKFYLDQFKDIKVQVTDMYTLANNKENFLNCMNLIFTQKIDKIIDLDISAFESAKLESKKYMAEQERIFEKTLESGDENDLFKENN